MSNIKGNQNNNLLNGTALADTIDGGAANDTLYGFEGNDKLLGGSGFDTIYGGSGNDTIDGGSEDDYLVGGIGTDSIIAASGNDIVYGDDENPFVASGNLLVNGSFEDAPPPSASVADFGYYGPEVNGWVLEGGVGQFEVVSTGYRGVPSSDGTYWLDMDASPANISVSQTVAGLANGETFHLSFDVANTPPHSDNGLLVYWGGQLVGNVTNATNVMQHFTFDVVGGAGDGSNKLTFAGTGDPDYYGLSLDNVVLTGNTIETGGADTIDAGSGNDTVYAGAGNDIVDGEAGRDLIYGGTGNDTLTGGAGSGEDTLYGGAGDDKLDAGTGADSLIGGLGADTLTGGNGGDTFVYNAIADSTVASRDFITDFDAHDTIVVSGLGFTGIVAGAASGTTLGYAYVGGDTVITAAGSDFSIIIDGKFALTSSDFVF